MLCREKLRNSRVDLTIILLSISIWAGPAHSAPEAVQKPASQATKAKLTENNAKDKTEAARKLVPQSSGQGVKSISRSNQASEASALTPFSQPARTTSTLRKGSSSSSKQGKTQESTTPLSSQSTGVGTAFGKSGSSALKDGSKKAGSTDSRTGSNKIDGSSTTASLDRAADRYKQLNNSSPRTTKAKPRTREPRATLIPPPPPTMPTYLDLPTSDFGDGFSVQFMSLDDLKFQLKNVEKKLAAANEDEEEQKRVAKEKQERATRFDELYNEGVVSRKELEQSHTDAERAKRELEQVHIKVEENSRLMDQVKERISALESKSKKQSKVAEKKNPLRKKTKKQTSLKSEPQEEISR